MTHLEPPQPPEFKGEQERICVKHSLQSDAKYYCFQTDTGQTYCTENTFKNHQAAAAWAGQVIDTLNQNRPQNAPRIAMRGKPEPKNSLPKGVTLR